MSTLFFLVLLHIQFYLNTRDILSITNSNCSLLFQIQTIDQSNIIQTNFPIDFLAIYNLACDIQNLTAYYRITPLSILFIGKYKNKHEKFKSMVELHSTQFRFNINQSLTIRLCVLSADEDDDHSIEYVDKFILE